MQNEPFICTKSIAPEVVKQKIDEVVQLTKNNHSLPYKPVIMIAGFTESFFEFQEGNYRIINTNVCHGCYNNSDIIFDKGNWFFCPQDKNLNITNIKNKDLDIINNYDKKILITGSGRSGTTFSSQVFQRIGFDLPHEKLGKHGMVSGVAACRNHHSENIKDFNYAIRPDINFDYIIHQTRHPLKAISSIVPHMHSGLVKFFNYFVNIPETDSNLLRSMKYWYQWNCFAEELTDFQFQIENFYEAFDSICEYIDLPQLSYKKELINSVHTKTNTWSDYKTFSWEELEQEDKTLFNKIREKSKQYGYLN